jgi:alginate O-acetyltransferase complex protein AlgI
MLFHSYAFIIFFLIFLLGYWFAFKSIKSGQNLWIVAASYLFYGFWDWRFGTLMLLSTLIDYGIGLSIYHSSNKKTKKTLVTLSIILNLGFLFVFKYLGFFVHQAIKALSYLGISIHEPFLTIILPVGISFYTFQTLSYSIDIYRGKIEPTKSFIEFAAFVSFFPQLVAGPIERASHLLPQFQKLRKFDATMAMDGLKQFFWGLFKKVVVANQCAAIANITFEPWTDASGIELFIGTLAFSFQIYGDFSGYSDMAIGLGKIIGFQLNQNFNYPYFATSLTDFWRKWHISLSSWFKDYVYIPLGGNRHGPRKTIIYTAIVFLLSGIWHGANWTFMLWGGVHATMYFLIPDLSKAFKNDQTNYKTHKTNALTLMTMLLTFMVVNFSWVIFRAEDYRHAIRYFVQVFAAPFFQPITLIPWEKMLFIVPMISLEWLSRDKSYGLACVNQIPQQTIRWVIYLLIGLCILIFQGNPEPFIYFQF